MHDSAFQTCIADGRMERHRHGKAYAALVLEGGYVEAGDRGRFHARPGQVLIHGPWESHMDAFSGAGARVLNLPLTGPVGFGAGAVADPDAVARTAERDLAEGLAPATVSRGFRQAFGTSPRRYRAEQRALKAAEALVTRADALAALAVDLGFVDQAHMTRAVAALTGLAPGRLRSSRYNPGPAASG